MRTGLSAVVIGCILASGGGAQLTWQRVADQNSRVLAGRLSRQVADAVVREVAGRIGEAEASYAALRTILAEGVVQSGEADRREVLFLSQIVAQQAKIWSQQMQIAVYTAPNAIRQTVKGHDLEMVTQSEVPSATPNWIDPAHNPDAE